MLLSRRQLFCHIYMMLCLPALICAADGQAYADAMPPCFHAMPLRVYDMRYALDKPHKMLRASSVIYYVERNGRVIRALRRVGGAMSAGRRVSGCRLHADVSVSGASRLAMRASAEMARCYVIVRVDVTTRSR